MHLRSKGATLREIQSITHVDKSKLSRLFRMFDNHTAEPSAEPSELWGR